MNYYVLREEIELENIQKKVKVNCDKNALIQVKVEILGKGTLSPNALICLPEKSDLESDVNPEEPIQSDSNEEIRKRLREKHRIEKIRSRKKWKKLKDELAEYKAKCILDKVNPDQDKCDKLQKKIDDLKVLRANQNDGFNAKMNDLWLTDNPESIKDSASRTVLGFVVNGGYSYRRGKSIGVGFVPYLALERMEFDKKGSKCLVRECQASIYRWAQLEIINHV